MAAISLAALLGSLHAQLMPAPTPVTPDATSTTDGQAATPAPVDGARRTDPTRASQPRDAMVLPQVQIKGNDATEARRLSTAAKIIIGREEIELYGDTTMGELMKRLPGVTVQGRPGRGGAPRMRGLGSGYTQILIDGERLPRGFSLDDLSPEEIERIEILRAPTAETGARAIAGTINIITRGGFTKNNNDLKLGFGLENGHIASNIAWSRNDTAGDLVYNFSIAAAHNERSNDGVNDTLIANLTDGSRVRQSEAVSSTGIRDGLHANARLQWRGSGGDSFTLMPMLATAQNSGSSNSRLTQTVSGTATGTVADMPYDRSTGSTDSRFATARLAGVWVHKLDDGASLRLSANAGQSAWTNNGTRQNTSDLRGVVATSNQHSEQHDTTLSANAKYSRTIAENHSLVTGLEVESNRRNETATTLQNGEAPLSEFDGNLTASSLRTAFYMQDDWNVTPHWAANAGVRWERIATTGTVSAGSPESSNQSQVLTPLFHAVWRPNLTAKDQFRISLTRSYRSPNLQDLIARPNINSMFLNRGANDEVHPDRAGNAYLQPELASGIDLAFEHYVPGGGLLSANIFFRQIQNLMRSQTVLETVTWADVPRWVARKQNIGNASTQGIELEAKFRLSEMFPDAPKIDLRSNLSVFRSSVDGIPGPDNRLDQQPDGTANLGADYQMTSLPLKIGGNINWTPQFTTRLSDDQTVYQSDKFVADAYALWTINPRYQLRMSVSNFAGRDYVTSGSLLSTNPQDQTLRETTQTIAPSFVNVQVRLEMKL